ncbi:MAG: phage shock protein PspA [Chitinivibrionales bacterium]|nr:phage shock protein PspA [Chitinivibrionales bacterium]
MGIFTRFKDIVSSNLNAMLDKAEDPEKMIRLMIQEMEETLVELKASCAGTMADKLRVKRDLAEIEKHIDTWSERAQLAVDKGRDDLAKEALLEKQKYQSRTESLQDEQTRFDALIGKAQDDIGRLEEKINAARQKQRLLVQRHLRAQQKMQAEKDIRRASSADAVMRFEEYESKIDRMEAAADLVNPQARSQHSSLEDEFSQLENSDTVEQELAKLKEHMNKEK